ncbi:MAG: hypothetical protein A2857_00400 [Candidatus Levybacteria bacterium RIFCSPHIGHO2_01_FULL_36_15]|nr:MAG: hypothetical protein A2857_00400 [Candidatus Levybacteria bacterium RIFCSPHIGHO2_01_FULL_36_15]OGH38834.1 MAG: hypothetical protein A2905_02980 [Candidatus Levybacteria bacterium RIFCSPLOWO2_01_FULL_36_10]
MKVLFFTYDFPYPTNSGGKTRAYNLLKFAAFDIDITLFSFIRDSFKMKNIENIKALGIKNIKLFKRRKLKDPRNILAFFDPGASIFRRLYFTKDVVLDLEKTVKKEKIDIIHFESFYTGFYMSSALKKTGARIVFGTENIESKIYYDYAKHMSTVFLKPLYFWEALKIKKEEESFFKFADSNIAVSQEEADYIKKKSANQCFVVENGIDLNFFKFKNKSYKKNKEILFVGNFSYFPNVEGACNFYENVFKNIKDKNIFFTVIGNKSTELSFAKCDRIKTFEYIEDVREAYYNADVFVFPVRFGGGTNFKILEAMSCGTPVVGFCDRAKSINAEDGKDILFVEDSNEFKNKILELLGDTNLRMKISENARAFVQSKYSWITIGNKLNKIWKNI